MNGHAHLPLSKFNSETSWVNWHRLVDLKLFVIFSAPKLRRPMSKLCWEWSHKLPCLIDVLISKHTILEWPCRITNLNAVNILTLCLTGQSSSSYSGKVPLGNNHFPQVFNISIENVLRVSVYVKWDKLGQLVLSDRDSWHQIRGCAEIITYLTVYIFWIVHFFSSRG